MSAAWAADDDPASRLSLADAARGLFPHDGLANAVYLEVVDDILQAAHGDPSVQAAVADFERLLAVASGGHWPPQDAAQLSAVLDEIALEAAFASMVEWVRSRLYLQPALWAHIAYPGSAVEHGGYLERGFDDIDWLPEIPA
jgi:hypothetical protein